MSKVIRGLDEARAQAKRDDLAWQAQQKQYEDEHDRRARKINAFLAGCGAVTCPVSAYAVWLATWLDQGGSIRYPRDCNLSHWRMATKSTDLPIPTAYGAQTLELLIPPNLSIPTGPSSNDGRHGWEFGHGKVLWFANGMAVTNSDYVASYLDVEEYIRKHGDRLHVEVEQRTTRVDAQRIPEIGEGNVG